MPGTWLRAFSTCLSQHLCAGEAWQGILAPWPFCPRDFRFSWKHLLLDLDVFGLVDAVAEVDDDDDDDVDDDDDDGAGHDDDSKSIRGSATNGGSPQAEGVNVGK